MKSNEFLSILFKPIWTWFIGGILAVVAAVEFFVPSLQSVLTWPAITAFLPWYFWLSLALLIWVIGIAWEVSKNANERKVDQQQLEPPEYKQLAKFRTAGVRLRNSGDGLTDPNSLSDWMEAYTKWDKKVLKTLGKLSAGKAEWLRTLDKMPIRLDRKVINSEHLRNSVKTISEFGPWRSPRGEKALVN